MTVEDPRFGASDADGNAAISFQENTIEAQDEPIVLAQADGDPAPLPGDGADGGTGGSPVVVPSEITPDASNVVRLPVGVTIDELRVDGADIILVQADGSEIRIVNAALNIPTFVIDGVAVPQEVLVAVLSENGINVAAGPEGQLTVVGPAPQGSGANFQDQIGSEGQGGPNVLGLLQNTELGGGGGGEEQLSDGSGIAPTILADGDTGTLIESDDVPGGIDAEPAPATGTISFFDPDFGETRTAEITGRTVVASNIFHGPTLTQAQIDALLAGFTLDSPGGVTTEPSGAGNGSVDWTYTVTNALIDFLAAGETIVLDFEVTISDGINDVPTTVRVTVQGANDIPVFTVADIATVDEEAVLADGNDGDSYPGGSDTGPDALPPFGGSLGIIWGPDDYSDNAQTIVNGEVRFTGAITWSNGTPLKSRGEDIEITLSDGDQTITGTAPGGRVVFIATVDEQGGGNGSYTFEFQDMLDHPGIDAEDSVSLTFGLTVTDSNAVEQDHSFTVTINDDAPMVGSPVAALVDEAGPGGDLEPSGALLTQTVTDALDTLPTNPGDLPAVLATVEGEVGDLATAIAVVWDYLDDAYVSAGPNQPNINEAFVRLGVAYAEYIGNGGVPLAELTAKFTPDGGDAGTDPDRVQSLHDNLLGNLWEPALNGRFPEPLLSELKSLIATVDPDLLGRPYYAGNEGEDSSATRQWDLDHGFAPEGYVNEDDLPDGNDADKEPISVARGLAVYWGADNADNDGLGGAAGDRTLTFDPSLAGDSGLTADGATVFYSLSANGTLLTAHTGRDASTIGDVVFTVVLDDDGAGSYTFTLEGNLDHQGAGEDQITLDFGFVATDSDGDSATGDFSVTVNDDMPVADGAAVEVTSDEGDIVTLNSTGSTPFDTDADGSTTGRFDFLFGPAYSEGSVASVVSFGADGPAATERFGYTTDAVTTLQNHGLQSKGEALSFVVVDTPFTGYTIIGYVDNGSGSYSPFSDRTVMSFTLDRETGNFAFRLFDQLDHVDDGNNDTNTELDTLHGPLGSIDFGAVIEATDGDGDTITLDGKLDVFVTDDIPVADAEVVDYVRVDETHGPHSDNTNNPAVAALFNGGSLTAVTDQGADSDLPGPIYARFNAVDYLSASQSGADDYATYDLSLRVDDADSGLFTTEGDPIVLSLDGEGRIIGRTADGDAVFAIHIDGFGRVSIAQYVSLQHPDSDSSDEHISLDGKISAVLTVTDSDGDTVTDTVAIGGAITFDDDGPRFSAAPDEALMADEDDIVVIDLIPPFNRGSIGSDPLDGAGDGSLTGQFDFIAGPAYVEGSVGGLVSFGADGAASGGGFGFAANAVATMAALGLTSKGGTLLYTIVGDSLIGYVNQFASSNYTPLLDRTVFSLTLDEDSGDFEFRLWDQLDHFDDGNNDEGSELANGLDAIDFGAVIEATDGDGDSITLDGKLSIAIKDDVPSAPDVTPGMTENETKEVMLVDGSDFEFGADDGGNVAVHTGDAVITGAPGGVTLDVADVGIAFTNGDTITITPGTAFDALADGETAMLTIPYTVTDRDGDETSGEVTVTVTGANDAPIIDASSHFEFSRGFEGPDDTIIDAGSGGWGSVNLVSSGTGGIVTDDGGDFALIDEDSGNGAFTRFDGYRSEWTDDWTAEVKVYLDTSWANGTGFDYSVAANGTDGAHHRDFIFHVLKASDASLYVAGSNNSDHAPNDGKILGIGNKAEVTASGWYTLQHRFIGDGGVLKVELNLVDGNGAVLWTETRANAADTIPGVVGGNRYGWFVFTNVPGGVAVDGISLNVAGTDTLVAEFAEGHSDEGSGLHSASGEVTFTDVDINDAHSVNVISDTTGFVGTFTPAILDASTGDGEGTIGWTFEVTDGDIEHLGIGDTLTQTYTVEVDDGNGGIDTIDITVTITGANDAPEITGGDVAGAVMESGDIADIDDAGLGGGLQSAIVLATDLSVLETDGSQLEAVFAAVETELGGDAAQAIAAIWDYLDDNYVNGGPTQDAINEAFIRLGAVYAQLVKDGTITPLVDVMAKFTPDDGDANSTPERAQNLHDNLLGNVTSAAIAQRFGGDLLEGTLTALVNGVDAVLLTRPYFSGNEGADDTAVRAWDVDNGYVPMATGQLTATDVDAGETATLQWSGNAAGAYGNFEIDANTGEWTYKLDNSLPATQALTEGQPETETFTVTVEDENGVTDTIDVTVTVTGANDAPVIEATSVLTGAVMESGDIAGITEAGPGGGLSTSIVLTAPTETLLNGLLSDGSGLNAAFAAVLGEVGDAALAIAVIWDYLDDHYVNGGPTQDAINEAFVRLGLQYAALVKSGAITPLIDVVAKFEADTGADADTTPDRNQTLHDNLLGNLNGSVIEGRFADPLETTLKSLVEAVEPDLLARDWSSGYDNPADLTALDDGRAWDIAHGFVPKAPGVVQADDVDGGTLSYSVDGTGTGTYGSIVIDASTGQWTYTLDNYDPDTQALAEGQVAVDSFTIMVSDGNGGVDTVDVNINVSGADDLNPILLYSGDPANGGTLIGGFVTIQAAVDASADGNFVVVPEGTYNENVVIGGGKAITIQGAGPGTLIEGSIRLDNELNGEFAVKDLAIDATGQSYGVYVTSESVGGAGSVVLDGVRIEKAQTNGFAYIRAGNGSTPTLVDTIGAVSILNSEFANNVTQDGANGRGDILLYGFNGDLTIENVDIRDPGAFAQKAIQVRGVQEAGDVAGVGPYDPAGDVAINNLSIAGAYATDLIAFYRIADFDSFTTNDVDLSGATAPWGLINFDSVGGSLDLSSGFLAPAPGQAVFGVFQGLSTADIFTGTQFDDVFIGRGGDDNLFGQGGDDGFVWSVGDGRDSVDGGTEVTIGDTFTAFGAVSAETFDIYSDAFLAANAATAATLGYTPGDAEIVVARGGTVVFELTEIEEIVINGQGGGDTFNVHGGFGGTNLATSTISIVAGEGDDTFDVSELGSDHGIAFDGGEGGETAGDQIVYGVSLGAGDFSYNETTGQWEVARGGATDHLENVEIADGTEAGRFLLVGGGGFDSIQAAVDAAGSVAGPVTIIVAGGVYEEQIVVDGIGDLTIQAANGAEVNVVAPDDLVQTSLSRSGNAVSALLTVANSTNIHWVDIDVEGRGRGDTVEGTDPYYVGVFYRNASGSLTDVDIQGIRNPYAGGTTVGGNDLLDSGVWGHGLHVDNNDQLAFRMQGGSISDFQKTGAFFDNVELEFAGVTITGGGAQTNMIQNGIQGFRVTGAIAGNTITDIGYAGPEAPHAGGMLLYVSTDLDVTGNTITGANAETPDAKFVGIFSSGGAPSSGGSISGNTVSETDVGFYIIGDIEPDQIAIFDNIITDIDLTSPDAIGIYFDPTADLATPFDISGSGAADNISGAAGDDLLKGGAGDDVLDGRNGDDRLAGGLGIDTLTGGDGDDVFVIDPEVLNDTSMVDVIPDYSLSAGNSDTIDLSSLLDEALGAPPADGTAANEAVSLTDDGVNTEVLVDTNDDGVGDIVVAQLSGVYSTINILYDGTNDAPVD